jgi:hypothetical protein
MKCTHEHSLELYIILAYGGLVHIIMRHRFALASSYSVAWLVLTSVNVDYISLGHRSRLVLALSS